MPQGLNESLDEALLATLFVMYTIPDALHVAASLVGIAGPTMVAFEALESTAETGEMWSIAVSAEEDAKKALESAQDDLKATYAITIAHAREAAQAKATRKIEAAQGDLDAAVEEQTKMTKELGQSFIDWHECVRKEEDARREARNAELKKKNAEDLAEAKRKRKNKEKKTSEPEASEGRKKVKEGEPVGGILRDMPCALCEHGGFPCYDKTEVKGKACVACAASKQLCFIPAMGVLKAVLNGITERLDSVDGHLEAIEEKYEHLATGLNAIKGVLKEQGECLASLVELQAENQQFLEAIMEKLEVVSSKPAGKYRQKKRKASKAAASSEVVEIENDDDAGPSKKRCKVEKSKSGPQVVESEIDDEDTAEKEKQGEKEKGKEKEKEKTPEGLVDETMRGD
ncbi:hypothetical protein AURDEDRAFT_168563 [Auricularia subglabra TFB-10046 SS5]|nr:hypothetical protein AURDEDRAFT_168563 [Auricularia subglabra TFB-10046 SS5]